MDKQELIEELKRISAEIAAVESRLPYDYEQHDPYNAFLAQIRQRIYSVRCSLGSIRETLKDPRNCSDSK